MTASTRLLLYQGRWSTQTGKSQDQSLIASCQRGYHRRHSGQRQDQLTARRTPGENDNHAGACSLTCPAGQVRIPGARSRATCSSCMTCQRQRRTWLHVIVYLFAYACRRLDTGTADSLPSQLGSKPEGTRPSCLAQCMKSDSGSVICSQEDCARGSMRWSLPPHFAPST